MKRRCIDGGLPYPRASVGLRTGRLVGLDIDADDPGRAHEMTASVTRRLGETLVRVGRWPRRLLVYRAAQPFRKLACSGCEVLAQGQQLVAFGLHQKTGQPYAWLGDSPLDVACDALPSVDEATVRALVAELAQMSPQPGAPRERQRRSGAIPNHGPVRDAAGVVVDGRDAWLSTVAFHAVHDALDARAALEADRITDVAWRRFADTTDLARPRNDRGSLYSREVAAAKVADKLRLLGDGRLPARHVEAVDAPELPPTWPPAEARGRLDAALASACTRIEAWHSAPALGPAPQLGIKATVGLGKSSAARRHLLDLSARLRRLGAPSRILVCVPSLALADEAADAWRAVGVCTAVLRGYEAQDRLRRRPMCADLDAVRAAVEAGEDVQTAACASSDGSRRCTCFHGCLKQANRIDVAGADVVIAAYDALFTGFALQSESIALVVIDEGCWQRAIESERGLHAETFDQDPVVAQTRSPKPDAFAAAADLHALCARAAKAFLANGAGPLRRSRLLEAGLTVEDAALAIVFEARHLRGSGLLSGIGAE